MKILFFFLIGFVFAGSVQAACQTDCIHGEDPYPWQAQSWQFTNTLAANGARNKANIQCNANGLVRDTQHDQLSHGATTAQACPPLSYCRTANLYYWCKVPDPRFTYRTLHNIDGPRVCDNYDLHPFNLPAAQAFGAAASGACDAIRPNVGWFLKDVLDVQVSTIYTGSRCGSAGPDGPSNTRFYNGIIRCALRY